MQVLASPTPQSFTIDKEYVWLPDQYALPAQISCDVTCGDVNDEFIPCFSYTRAEWPSPDCDALSWYASPLPDSGEFTFRLKLFGPQPPGTLYSPYWRPTVGEKFSMKCSITATSATYSINCADYVTATIGPGDVPLTGYFGFAKFGSADEHITVENVVVTTNSTAPSGDGNGMSNIQVQQMVMYHNGYRAAVAVPDITWDLGLAFAAQQWADTLAANGGNLTHSEVRGENLFGGSGKAFSPGDVVNSWGSEKEFYSGQAVDAQNVETFGHYTQMVWSTTTNVGCGVATAADGTIVWVCRYSPPGNNYGEKPY